MIDRVNLRAAIYTRVSRDAKHELKSVTEQEQECREWAERERWRIVGVWCDNDKSASQYARPKDRHREDWEDLLEDIRADKIDLLVIWEPARATRDRVVWANLAALCQEKRVKIGASGRVYDLEEPEDMFQLDLFFALAIREPGIIRKRVNRAKRASRRDGQPLGKIPYGYYRKYKNGPGGQKLLGQFPDDRPRAAFALTCVSKSAFIELTTYTPAGVVRQALKDLLDRRSIHAVVRSLNRQGIPRPSGGGFWEAANLGRVVRNPAIIGMQVHEGQTIGEGKWTALVKPRDFYAYLAISHAQTTLGVRPGALKHPYSGWLVCGVCSKRLGLIGTASKGQAYGCVTDDPIEGPRYHTSRRLHRIDALIEGLLSLRLSRPDAERNFVRDEEESEQVEQLMGEIGQLRARLDEHIELSAKGELSALTLARVEAQVLPKVERLEAQLKSVRVLPIGREVIRPTPAEVIEVFRGMEPSQQRAIVEAVFEEIRVFPVDRNEAPARDLMAGISVRWRRTLGDEAPATASHEPAPDTGVRWRRVSSEGTIQVEGWVLMVGRENKAVDVRVKSVDDTYEVWAGDRHLPIRWSRRKRLGSRPGGTES